GAPANATISSNITPGNYLIRHELFALQIAQTEGGAELYPACVSIGGEGTGTPTDELVQLPGAYSDTEPGFLVDVYSNPDADYVFPGPAVAAFVSGSTDSASSSSS
ncbi:glycosyl hydrolase family 61-domain-containing protein, partial [Lentinula raphanica]